MGEGEKSNSGSKGGYAAKEEAGNAIFKVMVKFEGDLLEFNDIKRIEKQAKHSTTSATGQDFTIIIRFNSYPFNKTYTYFSESARDKAYLKLEAKLQSGKTMIL